MDNKKEPNQTDDLFRDAFADLEETPSPSVWDGVEKVLDEDGRKRPGIWWLSGLGLALFLGIAVWFFWGSPNRFHLENPGKMKMEKPVAFNPTDSAKKNTTLSPKPALSDSMRKDSLELPTSGQEDSVARYDAAPQQIALTAQPPITTNNPIATPGKSSGDQPSVVQPNASLTEQKKVKAQTRTSAPSGNAGQTAGIPEKQINSAKNKEKQDTDRKEKEEARKKQEEETLKQQQEQARVKKEEEETARKKQEAEALKQQEQQALIKKESEKRKADSIAAATAAKSNIPAAASTQDQTAVQQGNAPTKTDSASSARQDSTKKKAENDSLKKIIGQLPNLTPAPGKDSSSVWGFSVSAFASPEIYMNKMKSYNGAFDVKSEKTNPRAGGGIRFGAAFRDKVEVNIGCSYSQINSEFNSHILFFPKNISQPYVFNTSLGDLSVPVQTMLSSFNPLAPVTDFKCNYQYTETVQFLNVPINARINFRSRKFCGYVSAGINIQYAFSSNATLELLKENETDRVDYNTLDIRKLNYAACLGAGVEYRIAKKLSVFLEPNARLNLLPVTNSSAVQSSATYYGATGGLRMGW